MSKILFRDFPDGPVLRLHAPSEGGLDSIPGWGTRPQLPHLRVCMLRLRDPHAETKI